MPGVRAGVESGDHDAHQTAAAPLGDTVQISQESDTGVDLGDTVRFDLAQTATFSAWVRPTRYGAIISRMDRDEAYRGFDLLINPDGRLSVHLIHHWPDNATKVTSQVKIPLKHWTFVTVAIKPPGRAADVSISFDGVAIETEVEQDSLEGTIETAHPTWVGFRIDTQPFAGQIAMLTWTEGVDHDPFGYNAGLGQMATALQASSDSELEAELQRQFDRSQPELQPLCEAIRDLEEQRAAAEQDVPSTMVMQELETPRQAYVLKRGQYDLPDETQPVEPGVPALFAADRQPRNRLELAQWLVNGQNPLTARVAVNHVWSRLFGRGLHETPENFGVQSPPPSHPELLDWLATEFVRIGWDVKALQKLIVTSATYRQASAVDREYFERDPDNRWLARGARYRLPAEVIRDNALAISGLLSEKRGGPSVKPYQPEGLWEELAGGAKEPPYVQATDEDLYRRSLYTYRKRTVPHPTMSTFDGTSREICAVARSRTNTPLQALALLNDTTYVEAARQLATLAMTARTSNQDRIAFAFRRAVARPPSDDELAVLEAAWTEYRDGFRQQPQQAEALLTMGEAETSEAVDPVELAAYTTLANVILNLDETITRE